MKKKIIKSLLIATACISCFFIGTISSIGTTKVEIPNNYVDITTINGWDEFDNGTTIQLEIQTDDHDYTIEKIPFTGNAINTWIN